MLQLDRSEVTELETTSTTGVDRKWESLGLAVVILVAASQGHFDAVSDDVTAMLRSLRAVR